MGLDDGMELGDGTSTPDGGGNGNFSTEDSGDVGVKGVGIGV